VKFFSQLRDALLFELHLIRLAVPLSFVIADLCRTYYHRAFSADRCPGDFILGLSGLPSCPCVLYDLP